MQKTRILLLFGGRSVEHDISIRSCRNVFDFLDKNRFEPILVGITKSGHWYLQDSVEQEISTNQPVSLELSVPAPTLTDRINNRSVTFDVVFPVLHGTDGEDGSIQGLFTAIDAPVVGSDVLGSATSMDKLVSKKLLTESGIPNTRYLAFDFTQKDDISFQNVASHLGMPVIIKPVNLGSSVGVAKATDEQSFSDAIDNTFEYDNTVLIEEFVEGREFEIAVLGNANPQTTVPGEVIISGDYEFYDFNAKYVDPNGATTKIPADLAPGIIETVQSETKRAYKALNCCDYARVDFFIDKSNNIYINEINTIPGFTNISMFPKLWEYEGISNTDLITRLVDLCLERYQLKNRVTTDFESDLK